MHNVQCQRFSLKIHLENSYKYSHPTYQTSRDMTCASVLYCRLACFRSLFICLHLSLPLTQRRVHFGRVSHVRPLSRTHCTDENNFENIIQNEKIVFFSCLIFLTKACAGACFCFCHAFCLIPKQWPLICSQIYENVDS